MKKSLLKEQDLKEIASELVGGLTCFVNTKTGEFICMTTSMLYDYEIWEEDELGNENDNDFMVDEWIIEDFRRLKSWEEVVRIEPMLSSDSFEIMEDFVEECVPENDPLSKKLFQVLRQSHPFRKFKDLIEYSDYRLAWFDFRDKAYMNYALVSLNMKA